MPFRFRFHDKSKQRKPVKASERRTGETRDRKREREKVRGEREKGDLFRVRGLEGLVTFAATRSGCARSRRTQRKSRERITNAFCVIR